MKPLPLIAVGLSIALMAGCAKRAAERPLTPVTVKAAEPFTGDEVLRYSANVVPYTTVDLAFKVGGYVTEILQVRGADGRLRNAQDGDFVRRGTLLARLRQTEFQNKVAEVKARLAEANAELQKTQFDFDRAKTLFGSQSLTRPDYDAAMARFDSARAAQEGCTAAVQQAELELHDSSMRAPNDGVLLKRSVEIGTLITPGTLAFVLADTRLVKVVFGVPDIMLPQAKLGATLKTTTEALGSAEVAGRVTRVAPAADSKTRLFEVELTIPNASNRLKPGMIASLRMPLAKSPEMATVVPLSSIVASKDDPSGYAVYVVEQSAGTVTARRRPVKLGKAYGNTVAVTEGIRPGENVVATGTLLLNDGDRVRVVPQVVPR